MMLINTLIVIYQLKIHLTKFKKVWLDWLLFIIYFYLILNIIIIIQDANTVGVSKAKRTIKHGARFSRKLQRRLTRRTLAEARALKEQGTECIHVLLYVVELIATDPIMAFKKSKQLWASLSLPEPENQSRPATLEQLLVLLTRESARRIVHVVNGTTALASTAPRRFGIALMTISHQLLTIADAALKVNFIFI